MFSYKIAKPRKQAQQRFALRDSGVLLLGGWLRTGRRSRPSPCSVLSIEITHGILHGSPMESMDKRNPDSRSFQENQCKIIPSAISFLLCVNIKTIGPYGFKNIYTACLHKRSDSKFFLRHIRGLILSLFFTGRSGGPSAG